MRPHARHLIGGQHTDDGEARTVHAPADGAELGQVAHGDATTARQAADAAAAAFPGWAATPARTRGDTLLRAAEAITAEADDLGRLLAHEAGKRVPEAQGEVRMGADYLRWAGEEARRLAGQVLPHEAPGRRHLTLRQPAGVAVCLTPWNFPVSIQARKLGPALAAGCTVVARVSEKAPLAVSRFIDLVAEAGLPPGVLNLVHGPAAELTDALLDHPAVRVVSFTGSTRVGRGIMERAAARMVTPLLELGGDAPFLVFDDADPDVAVEQALLAKYRNNGQSCIAANRIFVHRAVYDDVVPRLVAASDELELGDPMTSASVDLGPLIDTERVRAVDAMVAEALDAGAHRLTRDRDRPSERYAVPTLVADVPDDASLACDEVFGPAAGVFAFDDTDEVVRLANRTEMGLAAYLCTRDLSRAWRVAERLEAGIVGVNNGLPSVVFAPMGGVKQSGLGREGAAIGLEEFCETKYVSLEL